MNQEGLHKELSSLERRIKLVLGEYNNLKSEMTLLKAENEELRSVITQKEEQLKHFQNQENITKIVSSIGKEERGESELKDRIDEYIKEIDKCIAHLTQ